MSGDSSGGTRTGRTLGQRLKRGVESKILVPVAATIVSAAASYLAKKLPLILEEKVLPKLREKGAPQKVTSVLEQTSAVLGDGASATGTSGDGGNGKSSSQAEPARNGSEEASEFQVETPSMSEEEREEERRKREERRRERKAAPHKAS